jgi:uncharacterized membrane protein YvbJ
MSYCPKCGNKVEETMTFCPRCGASLKGGEPARTAPQPAPPPTYRRNEKGEKGEKQEKNEPEKGEKHEKGEVGIIGWVIAGIVIIVIGLFAFVRASGYISSPVENALVILIIGIAVIVVAIWLSTRAKRRSPPP